MEEDLEEGLHRALGIVEHESQTPRRSRSTEIGVHIQAIAEHGYQFGFSNNDLERIMTVVAKKNELDQTSITSLVKNLFPKERLASTLILLALSGLGQGSNRPSLATQAVLLRWLCNVQQVQQEPEYLLRFYALLFNLLDILAVRVPLCQLLVLLTRRRHVRPFRVQNLLALCQQYGDDVHLTSILKVYKNFWPDIVINNPLPKKFISLAQQDIEWRSRLSLVQSNEINSLQISGFSLQRAVTEKKHQLVPEVHTFHAQEAAVTLEDIDSVEAFVAKLETIEPPSQVVASLRDPLFQKYLHLSKSNESTDRLTFWLQRTFDEEIELIEQGFGNSPTLSDLLQANLEYARYSQQLHPAFQNFLSQYLPLWDGYTQISTLHDLLIYLSPSTTFDALRQSHLIPFERAICSQSPFDAANLFDFYSKLHCQWLISFSAQSSQHDSVSRSIQGLNSHVAELATSTLVQSPLGAHAILNYYHNVIRALFASLLHCQPQRTPPIPFPSPVIFYLLIFHPDTAVLSLTASLIAELKALVETIIAASRAYPTNLPQSLNSLLMDTVNLLYRGRGFVHGDANAAASCLQDDEVIATWNTYIETLEVVDGNLASLFGVSWHPCISSMAKEAWKDKVMTEEPLGPRQVDEFQINWKEYRVGVLNWMEGRGLNGVKHLTGSVLKNTFV